MQHLNTISGGIFGAKPGVRSWVGHLRLVRGGQGVVRKKLAGCSMLSAICCAVVDEECLQMTMLYWPMQACRTLSA